MKIIHITDIPDNSFGDKVFFCNNSLMHLKDDIFLMTFRRIEYTIPNKQYLSLIHPWKMWDNGYKFLHPDPHNVDKNIHYGKKKFRRHLGPDRFVDFRSDDTHLNNQGREFDSTGMVVLQYQSNRDPPFRILHFIDNIFGEEMNQDCRIYKNSDGHIITDIFIHMNAK